MTETDLRRARTVAEHLWRRRPSPTSAAAGVLVATRSAAANGPRRRKLRSRPTSATTMIISDTDALGVTLPDELVTFEPPADATSERDALMAFGDQLFEVLEAGDLDPALVDRTTGAVAPPRSPRPSPAPVRLRRRSCRPPCRRRPVDDDLDAHLRRSRSGAPNLGRSRCGRLASRTLT